MAAIDLFRLDNRTAIITGGSKGLGQSMGEALASAGANVLLTSRNQSEVESAADRISQEYGRKAIGLKADVVDASEVQRTIDCAMDSFGKIDILINNAGINIRNPIEEMEQSEFEQVMATNVTGPWLMCRAVAPHMKRAEYGRVINVSSTLGEVALPGRTPYASSKGAIRMMTKVLAMEWAKHGITVNSLCPGPFLTPMNEPIADRPDTQELIINSVPMNRWGKMHEIQGAAIFLASDASSYVTGASLFVDGGWTAR
jgi:NAD(P)-dependent dehydrogenase (short-subunit alcohol dehydrogenase family)